MRYIASYANERFDATVLNRAELIVTRKRSRDAP